MDVPRIVIDQQELAADAVSVTLIVPDRMAQRARHLHLSWSARCDDVAAFRNLDAQFNFDGGANYNDQILDGTVAVAAAARQTGVTEAIIGTVAGAGAGASGFGSGYILIPHAFNTVNHVALIGESGAVEEKIRAVAARWADTEAIHTIVITVEGGSNILAGSTFTLSIVDEDNRIGEIVLDADGTFTFSGIPSAPGDLVAVGYLRSDRANTEDNPTHEINGDAVAANYLYQRVAGAGAATGASTAAHNEIAVSGIPGDNATAAAFGALLVLYSQYNGGINNPHCTVLGGFHETSLPNSAVVVTSARRDNVAPITSLKYQPRFGTNFKAGSMMSLYFVPRRRLIERQVTTGLVGSVTLTVPSSVEGGNLVGLMLAYYAGTDRVSTVDGLLVEFNGDTVGADYDFQRLFGSGAGVTAAQSAASQLAGIITGNSVANVYGGGSLAVAAPLKADRHKARLDRSGNAGTLVQLSSSRWENLGAITSIVLSPETGPFFEADCVFELWGIVEPTTRDASFHEHV